MVHVSTSSAPTAIGRAQARPGHTRSAAQPGGRARGTSLLHLPYCHLSAPAQCLIHAERKPRGGGKEDVVTKYIGARPSGCAADRVCPGRARARPIEKLAPGEVDTRTIAPRPAAQRGFVGRGAMGEKYFVVSLSVHFIGLQTILQHENERRRAEPPAGGHSGAWRARQGGPCMHEAGG